MQQSTESRSDSDIRRCRLRRLARSLDARNTFGLTALLRELTSFSATRRKKRRAVYDNDEQLKKKCIQGYYAHTAALDDCIGKIRVGLREAGLAENTILVFSSDHGDMLGSHRMALKQMPFEESINVPFLVEYPRSVPGG